MLYKTGIPFLNDSLGGGIPSGLAFLHGDESSGVTSLALSIMRESTMQGQTVGFVNAEARADPKFISKLLDKRCLYSVPRTGEQAIETAYALLTHLPVVCIDTVDALVPLPELSLLVGEREMNAQRKLVYHGMSVLAREAASNGKLLILTGQVRCDPSRPSLRTRSPFADMLVPLSEAMIILRKKDSHAEYGVTKYTSILATVEKLTTSPPLGTASMRLFAGVGFDRDFELLLKLLDLGIVTNRAGFFKLGEHMLGRGYTAAHETIKADYSYFRGKLDEHTSSSSD